VSDYGNGTSLCEGLIFDNPLISVIDCATSFFNTSCSVYSGNIEIVMSNAQGLGVEAYVAPDIATWLNNIGLGSLTILQGDLTVFADHTPYPLPAPIAPVFLTSLQQARNMYVIECEDCATSTFDPPVNPSRLFALPGLQQIIQLTGEFDLTFLVVRFTAFQDLTSFSGLACLRFAYLSFTYNSALQSFNGLEAVQPLSDGFNVDGSGSGPFTTADSVAGLRSLAGCISGSAFGRFVTIPIGCDQVLTSFQEICDYQGVICR
jgi:hypothetical protein